MSCISTFADVASLMSDSNENSELASELFDSLPETEGFSLLSKLDASLPKTDYRLSELLRIVFVKFTVGLRMLKNGMGC